MEDTQNKDLIPNYSLLEKCKIIDLPKINEPRGNLTFVEREAAYTIRYKTCLLLV